MATAKNAQRRATQRQVVPGLAILLPVYAERQVDDVTVEVEVDMVDGRLGCTRIVATAGSLSGDVLRRLPIAEVVRDAGRSWAVETSTTKGVTRTEPLEPPQDYPATGPTPGALRYVAQVYRLAHFLGEPPTRAVEQTGLSRPTAGRWVARARDAGFLDPVEGPGKAGG